MGRIERARARVQRPRSLFDVIRARAAEVMRRARWVRVDPEGVDRFAERLVAEPLPEPVYDTVHHFRGEREATAAYVLTLAAINFGSGFFPYLRKRPGLSGYRTVASGLKRRFERRGPWTSAELVLLEIDELAEVLEQPRGGAEVEALLALYTGSLRELGVALELDYGGSFVRFIESARGSAERLVLRLAEAVSSFRDVERYQGLAVPFYKRAQLAAADLALAFQGRDLGAFRDLASLTAFADNLVPHVLRLEGVLRYEPALLERIERGDRLLAFSPEEVEIRAGAIVGVARVAAALRARGLEVWEHRLDQALWERGQAPEMKAHPRHRTLTLFY